MRGIKGPESISDHMYRMGLMALIAPDIPGIDRDKLVLFFFGYCLHLIVFGNYYYFLFFQMYKNGDSS